MKTKYRVLSNLKGNIMRLFTSHFLPLLRSLNQEQEIAGKPKRTKSLRGVVTPEMYAVLRKRNDARIQQTIQHMGTKWLGHRANHVKRIEGVE